MFKLFDSGFFPSEGNILPTNHRYLQVRAELIIHTLETYFGKTSYRLPNNHLLIQILRNLEYSLETPFEKVVETVNARALYVAKHFYLTSEIDFGRPHNGVFYSHKDSEAVDYLFAKSFIDINPFDEDRSWVKLSPLKVIFHSATDFKWLPIDGQPKGDPEGYAVVQIDIPLLALQYREFCIEMIKDFNGEAIYNPNKFLVTRVLPKLYRSHFDQLIINQFLLRANILKEITPERKLPIVLPEIELTVKQAINSLYPRMVVSRKTYANTLSMLPTVFTKNGLEALKLPSTVATRQSFWLQILSRFPIMEFLTQVQGPGGRNVNRGFISEFKREMGVFLNTKGYLNFNQPELQSHFLSVTQEIMNY